MLKNKEWNNNKLIVDIFALLFHFLYKNKFIEEFI